MAINDKLENVIDKLNTLIENGGGTPLPYQGGMPIEDHVEHISEQIDALPASGGGGDSGIFWVTIDTFINDGETSFNMDKTYAEIMAAFESGKYICGKVTGTIFPPLTARFIMAADQYSDVVVFEALTYSKASTTSFTAHIFELNQYNSGTYASISLS